MAALDAGGMVFFVDSFGAKRPEQPRITLKKVAFKFVNPEVLTQLDQQRMARYPAIMSGEQPFDPERKRLEMAF